MKRRILPILLISVGVYVLIGCIPIPATQQYMMNGELKPSYAIGSGKNKPIRLGYTTIDEAIETLNQRVAGKQYHGGVIFGGASVLDAEAVRHTWLKLDEHRYALPYSKRTGYWVWPLCFMGNAVGDTEYVLLNVDDQRKVVGYKTIGNFEKLGITRQNYSDFLLYPWPKLPVLTTRPTTRPTTTPTQPTTTDTRVPVRPQPTR